MIESGIPVGERPDSHLGIMGTVQQPWLPVEAIDFLSENLHKDFIGFEFGSGSSTFWFSKITSRVYSIESDPLWSEMMRNLANQNIVENIEFRCVECKMLPIWDIDLENYGNYKCYADEILKDDSNFDYILVDGVARSLCIENSIRKLKPGGFLIIDNAERPAYWDAMKLIPSDWEEHKFSNEVDTTLIYKKPFSKNY